MSTLISHKYRRARKQHDCNYCNLKINKGEVYSHSFLKEDDVYVWKNHISCNKLITEIKEWDSEGISNEDFFDMVNEKYKDLFTETDTDWHRKLSKLKQHYELD